MHHLQAYSWKRLVLSLVLFGTAFGYLEAAVVSYLRYLHEPVRQRFYPGRPAGELFPQLTPEQAAMAGPQGHKVRITEVGREDATIVMLAAVAMAASTDLKQWAAAFVIAFGVWDSTFYRSSTQSLHLSPLYCVFCAPILSLSTPSEGRLRCEFPNDFY